MQTTVLRLKASSCGLFKSFPAPLNATPPSSLTPAAINHVNSTPLHVSSKLLRLFQISPKSKELRSTPKKEVGIGTCLKVSTGNLKYRKWTSIGKTKMQCTSYLLRSFGVPCGNDVETGKMPCHAGTRRIAEGNLYSRVCRTIYFRDDKSKSRVGFLLSWV